MANELDFGTGIALIKGLGGKPTDAQVTSAVDAWLDDHPEATTTVEDGSITKAKLNSDLQDTVDQVGDLKTAIDDLSTATSLDVGKALSPKTVTNGKVTEWQYKVIGGGGGGGAVEDVQINETSIVNGEGVAEIPKMANNVYGVAKLSTTQGLYGLEIDSSIGILRTSTPSDNEIRTASVRYKPVTPFIQHKSTFYGLAAAAGDTTQKDSANAVGNYTESAKSAIRAMLGARSRDWVLLQTEVVSADDTGSVEFVIPEGVLALRVHCVGTNISAGRNAKLIFNALDRNVYLNNFQTSSQKNVMLTIGENACGYRDITHILTNDAENNIPLASINSKVLNCDYYFGGNGLSSLTLTAISTLWNTGDTITVYGLK